MPYAAMFQAFLPRHDNAPHHQDEGYEWGLRVWRAGGNEDPRADGTCDQSSTVFLRLETPLSGASPSCASTSSVTHVGRDKGIVGHHRIDVALRSFTHLPKTIAPLHFSVICTRSASQPAAGEGSTLTGTGHYYGWNIVVFGRNGLRVGSKWVFSGPVPLTVDELCSIGDVRLQLARRQSVL